MYVSKCNIIEYICKIFCIYFTFPFIMYVFDLDNFMEALQSAQRAEGSGSGLMRMRFALY